MNRLVRIVAAAGAAAVLAIAAVAFLDGAGPRQPRSNELVRGGTLRVAALEVWLRSFDPQKAYWPAPWELYRCCLLRTLLSYNAHPTDEGGSQLFPDLAESMPETSSDGLTWTFRLKSGLTYGPPLADTPIVANDFIRSLEREARARGDTPYAYYSVIDGFNAFRAEEADSIRGMTAPNARTLVVALNAPTSDLGYRFSLPATSPIPPIEGGGRLGAAEGHDHYGRFLVSSGPYMFEGSGALDFTQPSGQQKPVSGFIPGRSMTLVRNPSWSRATDELRGAYVDRIEITIRRSVEGQWARIDSGELDVVLDASPPPGVVASYRADPALAPKLLSNADNFVAYIDFNLAIPPFDDIHVRRALNWALDKTAMVEELSTAPHPYFGHLYGSPAGHIAPDSGEDGLLSGRDFYPSQGGSGDLQRASQEMAMSRYDEDHDGVCDAVVCTRVLALTQQGPFPAIAELIERSWKPLGVTLHVRSMDMIEMFGYIVSHPEAKVPLGLGDGWISDYPSASQSLAPQLRAGDQEPDHNNLTHVGDDPDQLAAWGYDVTEVPNIDARIDGCLVAISLEATSCWASLDQYVMEGVVPSAPWVFFRQVRTVSAGVTGFSFDQFTGLPALDQISLAPSST